MLVEVLFLGEEMLIWDEMRLNDDVPETRPDPVVREVTGGQVVVFDDEPPDGFTELSIGVCGLGVVTLLVLLEADDDDAGFCVLAVVV
jgi:hypothetical protein